MSVIMVKDRKDVMKTKEMKSQVIEDLSGAFTRVEGDYAIHQKRKYLVHRTSGSAWVVIFVRRVAQNQ